MQISTAQLNEVANLLCTTDKNLVFAACIKTLVESGVDVKTATDAVLGKGRFNEIASAVESGLAVK